MTEISASNERRLVLYVNESEEQSRDVLTVLQGRDDVHVIKVRSDDGIETPYLEGPKLRLFGARNVKQYLTDHLPIN